MQAIQEVKEIEGWGGWEGEGRGLHAVGLHCKTIFAVVPSPAGMSLTKLSLDGNTLIILVQGEFCK